MNASVNVLEITNLSIAQKQCIYNNANGFLSQKAYNGQINRFYGSDDNPLFSNYSYDISAIVGSKAYRELSLKNQVASIPSCPHIRNRGTHTSEVFAISTQISKILGLNVLLAQAIALGHDCGHVPFGHQGEVYLRKKLDKDFTHEKMSVILLQAIERGGKGLNLDQKVVEGIYRHSGANYIDSMTEEAKVVAIADKIAYIFSDYNDFQRIHWRPQVDLIKDMDTLGKNQRERQENIILAMLKETVENKSVSFRTSAEAIFFKELRAKMYIEYARCVEQDVDRFLDPLWGFFERSGLISPWVGISLLTDIEVLEIYKRSQVLSSKWVMETSVGEVIRRGGVDFESIDPADISKYLF